MVSVTAIANNARVALLYNSKSNITNVADENCSCSSLPVSITAEAAA